jgi:hypothetical protein
LAREGGGTFVVSGWDEMDPKDIPSGTGLQVGVLNYDLQ